MCIYSKTSHQTYPQINHSPIVPISILYFGPNPSPIQCHCNDIQLPKLTTSLNGPFKVGPWSVELERFYCVYIFIYIDRYTCTYSVVWNSCVRGSEFMCVICICVFKHTVVYVFKHAAVH